MPRCYHENARLLTPPPPLLQPRFGAPVAVRKPRSAPAPIARRELNGKKPFDLPPNTILLRPDRAESSRGGTQTSRRKERTKGRAVSPTTTDGQTEQPAQRSSYSPFLPGSGQSTTADGGVWYSLLVRLRLSVNACRVRSLFSRRRGVLDRLSFRRSRTSRQRMGCVSSSPGRSRRAPGYEDPAVLASQTSFTVNEVEALYELYKKLSYSIFKDGLIHKEEFQLALFRTSKGPSLFADRVFDLFDLKRNGVIEFGEFVRSLSIFHPKAPESDKTAFAFKLYDLRGTGYIEKEELRELVVALLDESDLCLSDSAVEEIVDNTFSQADSNGDDRIDPKEWEEFVKKNPASLRNMSLPYLQDITTAFPSFVMHSEVDDYSGISK
ncbi:hypothetical protein ZWY2020_044734 [Hordeum vulgare]|nr:hypothetical protein ZWY2020_044734 [Hordeum vulgare]